MTIPNYLLTFQRAVREQKERTARERGKHKINELHEISPPLNSSISFNSYTVAKPEPPFARLYRIGSTFAELEQRCPDHVDAASWQAAIADGRRFLARWGAQAERLGWTADDLFGLHEPPANPHPSYSRLARLDCAGLVWILNGRPVIALTGAAATIRATAGNLTWRRPSCAQSRRSPSHDLRHLSQ